MGIVKKWKRSKVKLGKSTRVAGWEMSPDEVVRQIKAKGKTVLTLFGYSGMGYEHPDRMLEIARRVLERFSNESTIVNIGATADGLGAIYKLARDLGFETSGIVSTCAIDFPDGFSQHVDIIYFVADEQWGGYLKDGLLSPTSEAMVAASDFCVGIGGNQICRDELIEAKRRGLPVEFYPADMNHNLLRKRMAGDGEPTPEDFRGEAHKAMLAGDGER